MQALFEFALHQQLRLQGWLSSMQNLHLHAELEIVMTEHPKFGQQKMFKGLTVP